jgi:ring-1,2-phenylacetyl-CoA epoxidase subunit PaaE
MLHNITIKEIKRETPEAVSIYLDIPANLKEEFKYIPGQYLTFEININGEEVRRAYSLCTSPYTDEVPAIAVKQVEGGKMSTYLNQNAKAGDVIKVMAPNGKFIAEMNQTAQKHYVLFGGGSGITPLRSILKSVLTQEPNSKVTLIYANRNPESVIFNEDLNNWVSNYQDRFKVFHSYDDAPVGWFGLKGYLDNDKIGQILNSRIEGSYLDCEYYICGPSPMMDVVKKGLSKNGVPDAKVHTEYFTAPTSSSEETIEVVDDADFNGTGKVTVHVYGKTHELEMDDQTTILDATNHEGLQAPYSCTIGVCTTCRAKVHKGRVHMIEREGLSDAEVEEGYILTCQSQIRSADVEITFE